jgi:hypothetical protein
MSFFYYAVAVVAVHQARTYLPGYLNHGYAFAEAPISKLPLFFTQTGRQDRFLKTGSHFAMRERWTGDNGRRTHREDEAESQEAP